MGPELTRWRHSWHRGGSVQTQMALMQLSPEPHWEAHPPQLPNELVKSTQPWPQRVRLGSLQPTRQPPSVHTAYPPFGALQATPPQVACSPPGPADAQAHPATRTKRSIRLVHSMASQHLTAVIWSCRPERAASEETTTCLLNSSASASTKATGI